MTNPYLVAHRGLLELCPENSMTGLEAALKCGADYVEFDVQSTADGKLVVFHDDDLARTTGISGNLLELTYEQIKEISAHEPDRFSDKYHGESIPRLKDVVGVLQKYPTAKAFVEIKTETLEKFGVNIIHQLLLELAEIKDRCIIISYHYKALEEVKKTAASKLGWVLHSYDHDSYQKAKSLGADYLIVNYHKLPENEKPWSGNWKWMVYDITDPELAMHYTNLGIDLIETANVCSMLEALNDL